MGSLNAPSTDKRWRRGGHRTALIDIVVKPLSSTKCLSRFGQTTDSRSPADVRPLSRTNSDHAHSSIAARSTKTSAGIAHVKKRARTPGTRLEKQTLHLPVLDWVRGWRGDHKEQGVRDSTRTCRVGTLRQAPHISRDASCSSSVDVYHRFSSPTQA